MIVHPLEIVSFYIFALLVSYSVAQDTKFDTSVNRFETHVKLDGGK